MVTLLGNEEIEGVLLRDNQWYTVEIGSLKLEHLQVRFRTQFDPGYSAEVIVSNDAVLAVRIKGRTEQKLQM
jgi:hypothetical protein